jgi:hypothetical protein
MRLNTQVDYDEELRGATTMFETYWRLLCPMQPTVVIVSAAPRVKSNDFPLQVVPMPARCSVNGKECCPTQVLLTEMWRRFPAARWYLRLADDAFLLPTVLARLLATHDPDQPLLLVQPCLPTEARSWRRCLAMRF